MKVFFTWAPRCRGDARGGFESRRWGRGARCVSGGRMRPEVKVGVSPV